MESGDVKVVRGNLKGLEMAPDIFVSLCSVTTDTSKETDDYDVIE